MTPSIKVWLFFELATVSFMIANWHFYHVVGYPFVIFGIAQLIVALAICVLYAP